MSKRYYDYDKIKDFYKSGLKIKEIAKKIGCNKGTIIRIARNYFGLSRINSYKRINNYGLKLIKRLYQLNLSTREVSKKTGYSKSTVISVVKKLKISRKKGPRLHIILSKANVCPEFSDKLRNFLDGLLISDGNLTKPVGRAKSSSYRQECVNLEWLLKIQKIFATNKINSIINLVVRKARKLSYTIRTLCYDKFYNEYYRWYENNKIVPRDIKLNDICLLKNWIYGDGTINGKTLTLCTDSFKLNDINFLIKELNNFFNVKFKRRFIGMSKNNERKYRIKICKRDGCLEFYTNIGKCELKCFEYKWLK